MNTQLNNIYYDYRKLNSYNATIKVVASLRGLGKTYGKVNELMAQAIKKDGIFLYLVENEPMLKELCINDGNKFMSQLYDNYDAELLKFENGIVYYDGAPRIQLYDLAHYGKIKRTKHNKIFAGIFDEFIELSNRTNRFNIMEALNSVIQSCARLNKFELWLLGNTENPNSPFVKLFELDKEERKGTYYTLKLNGTNVAIHYVDAEKEYPQYFERYQQSSSSLIANAFGQNRLATNDFGNCPKELINFVDDMTKIRKTCFNFNHNTYVLVVYDGKHTIVPMPSFSPANICIERNTTGLYMESFKNKLLSLWTNKILYFHNSYVYGVFIEFLQTNSVKVKV